MSRVDNMSPALGYGKTRVACGGTQNGLKLRGRDCPRHVPTHDSTCADGNAARPRAEASLPLPPEGVCRFNPRNTKPAREDAGSLRH